MYNATIAQNLAEHEYFARIRRANRGAYTKREALINKAETELNKAYRRIAIDRNNRAAY